MRLTKKKVVLLLFLGSVSYWYYQDSHPNIWGDEANEPYITVSGKKPTGSTVKSWVDYTVSGEECETYSYDMFGKKAYKGGGFTKRFTHNFSGDENYYDLRIPYTSYVDKHNCIVELDSINVEFYNPFDTVGFAQLRIYQAGNDYNNKPIPLDSKIEARDCEPFYIEKLNRSTNGNYCTFYVNEKRKGNEHEFSYFNINFDFTQFNEETVIHYDILAGDDYRSTPLDPKTGK